MDALVIMPTASTPLINFNPQSGEFKITGRSTPEYPSEYYSKIYLWIGQYIKSPCDKTLVKIDFEYFNTSSSKYVLDVLKRLITVLDAGKEVKVQWCYEAQDDDMRDAGMDFSELLKVPFEMIEKQQSDAE